MVHCPRIRQGQLPTRYTCERTGNTQANQPKRTEGLTMLDRWEKFERVVFLLGLIVVLLDLFYWRPL